MPQRPGYFKIWLAASRPRTLPAAAAPVIAASALAGNNDVFQAIPALVCLLFALLIQIGANFANDYYDGIRGTDSDRGLGPARAVAAGWVTPAAMLAASFAVLGLAVAVGLLLVAYGGWWLVAVGLVSVLCAIAYTGGPYPLGYHGFGDVFVILFFGLVATVFSYYVQAGVFSSSSFWIGTGIGFLTNNILVVNNYRDMDGDRKAGKRTLIAKWGRRFGEFQYGLALAVGAAAATVLCFGYGYSAGVFLATLALVPGLMLWRRLPNARSQGDYSRLLGGSGWVVLTYAGGLAVGLLL